MDIKGNVTFPKIGMRNLKTAVAATLCALIYAPFDRNPTFACIGAVFAMNNSLQNSWVSGGNRLIGTIIGGFVGMGFFYLYQLFPPFFPGSERWSESLFLFIGIIVMNLASQFFHANDAIPPASVVFYIVMLNTPENEYISYALNRMFDTGFGVILSILINVALPREFFERHMSRRRLEEEISALELERLEYDLSVEKKLTALEELESQTSNSSREALS